MLNERAFVTKDRHAPGIPRRVGMECPAVYLSRYSIASGIVRLTPQASLVRFTTALRAWDSSPYASSFTSSLYHGASRLG
ncbi:MAG: hypothetical protein ABSF13_12055 [Smithella sp.]